MIICLLALVMGPAGTAHSAPLPDPFAGDGPHQLRLNYLGSSDTLVLPGQQYSYELSFAVPSGTRPTALTGRTSLPPYAASGTIDVLDGDRLLSRTPIPRQPHAPVRLPLDGITVDQDTHSAAVLIRTYLDVEGYCTFEPDQGFVLDDARVTFAGDPAAPTSIATFLPPVLTGVTLYLPDDPREGEGAAAVNLAAAIVSKYHPAPVHVQTRALPRNALQPPASGSSLERRIVIAENLPDGLTLTGDGYLTLGGPDLSNDAAFLTADLSMLAAASAAIPGPAAAAPQLARDVSTLADIGNTDQQITTAGWPSLTIGIDQPLLGRPSTDVRVQLRGTYTPPPDGSGGQVVVTAGDTVVAAWPTDAHGTFDRWVDVPDSMLRRYTELRVTVERSDSRMMCGDATRASLSLSAAGEIQTRPADPPVPSGLQSVPQALMPRTQLAWTAGDVPDIARAVSLLTGLQRLSPVPLGVDMVDPAERDPARPAIVIAADGPDRSGVTPAIAGTGSGRIDVTYLGEQPAVTNSPAVAFGSLQVIAPSDGATVLLATSTGAPDLLDRLLTWLDDDPARWDTLEGVAVLQAGSGAPFLVPGPAAAPQRQTLTATQWVGVGAVVGVGVLAVLGGLLFWWRRRGLRPDPAD